MRPLHRQLTLASIYLCGIALILPFPALVLLSIGDTIEEERPGQREDEATGSQRESSLARRRSGDRRIAAHLAPPTSDLHGKTGLIAGDRLLSALGVYQSQRAASAPLLT